MKRKIWIPIDSVIALFADYTSKTNDIPYDTQALSLQINPTEQGKFRIVADSPQWRGDEPPLVVNFQVKRIYSV